MSATPHVKQPPHPLLRPHGGPEARVSNTELFFDLVYVFAVTQLSHLLLDDLSLQGALQTLLLWFAVWLGWQYTCWVTNWFDPDTPPLRLLLFALMLAALLMAVAIPDAFGQHAMLFAVCFVLVQSGRNAAVLVMLGGHALAANWRRILGWSAIAGCFWIAGALASGPARLGLWAAAVACEYFSPMFGFALPGLGRSKTTDWTIHGAHLAERCQLFVIVALGESILVTGATAGREAHWAPSLQIAFAVAFAGSLAMWWIYFDTGSGDGSHAIEHSADPGRLGAYFHYVHVIIVAGIIVCAVADDLSIAHPDAHAKPAYAAVLVGGPALYLLGNALFKRAVYGRLPLSHLVGLLGLAALGSLAFLMDLLMVASLTTLLLIAVAAWETRSRRGSGRHGDVD